MPGCGFGEGEQSPEEDQHADGGGNLFGEGESKGFSGIEEKKVKEDVVMLAGNVESGSFALLNQLGEPSVINVAAKIACFDVAMPEARHEQQRGKREDEEQVRSWRGGRIRIRYGRHFRVF